MARSSFPLLYRNDGITCTSCRRINRIKRVCNLGIRNGMTTVKLSLMIMIVSILVVCNYPNVISALSPSHPKASLDNGHPLKVIDADESKTTVQYHMRHRLSDKTSSSYRPKHLSSQYCRYIDDEKCRYYDEMLGEARYNRLIERQQPKEQRPVGPIGEYHRAIQSIKSPKLPSSNTVLSNDETHQRKLEQQHYEEQVSYHKNVLRSRLANYTKPRRLAPSLGTDIRVLVLLVKLKGHENRVLPNRTYFDILFNGNGTSDINPVGSIKEWFRYSSLGNYRVVFDVRDWQMASGTESDFAMGTSGQNGPEFQQTIATPILTSLDNSNSVDWLNGYVDEFGYLNQLVVLHSGYDAVAGDLACSPIESERSALNRLWSQGSSAIGPNGWKSKEMYQLNSYAVSSALDFTTCNSANILTTNPATMAQINHEYNHGFGLPDLYDQDTDEATVLMYGGISNFGVMANSWGWRYNGKANGHHDPWSRIRNEWLDPIEITQNGMYSIMPSEVSGQIFKIQGTYPPGEYLLIENRQPLKWDKDMDSIESTGIVIYHVDDNTDGQRTRGYPGHPNWPFDHYMVSVLQADGLYDIEKGVNDGDTGDFWKKGQILGPSLSTNPIYPNTNSILFGADTVTNIKITITSDPSFIMTFEVEGLPTVPRSTPKTGGDPRSTRSTIQWITSMLIGAAALLGLVFVFMAI